MCEGDDGREFIRVEHCGDDFLSALAESMQNAEDWDNDDFQAMETEACGNLTEMLDKDVRIPLKNYESGSEDVNSGSFVHVIEDSPKQQGRQNFVQVDSSSGTEEDEDFVVLSKMGRKAAKSGSSQDLGKSSWKQSSISEVFLKMTLVNMVPILQSFVL